MSKQRIKRAFRLYKQLRSEMSSCIERRQRGRHGIACNNPEDIHSVRYRLASWRAEVIEAYMEDRAPNYYHHPDMMSRGGSNWVQAMSNKFKGWRD